MPAETMVSPAAHPPQIAPVTAKDEWIAGWPVVLGAVIGIALGVIALPGMGLGVVMRSLQAEFGWTRTEISLAPTIMTACLAAAAPFVGWIADRVSGALIAAVSLSALAVSLYLLSGIDGSLHTFYLAYGAMAVCAAGSTTLIYARAIGANFSRGRGLALGVAMTGNGISNIVIPILLAPYVAIAGWRHGFVALAIAAAVAAPVVGFLMNRGNASRHAAMEMPDHPGIPEADGLRAVFRKRVFWVMAICFTLIPLAATGLHLHLLAFMADAGIDAAAAGRVAGTGGFALICGRLLTGWALDHFFAPWVGAAMMAVSSACLVTMAMIGAPAAVAGAVAVGLSIGAELDLIGYLTIRYFGVKTFGRVYGLLYTFVLVGSGVSPVAYGLVADATHSYTLALYGAAAILLLAAILFLTMFPRSSSERT